MTELILDTACAAGFGLPIEEFSNAVVTPKTELKIPGVFDAGRVLDVTELFASTRLPARSATTPVPLDFLWDKEELKKKLTESSTWKKVQPYLIDLKARAGRDDDEDDNEFELKIKRLCVIIEVRMREMRELLGMAEVYHSQYYGDERIIQAIALFLETGIRPEEIRNRPPVLGRGYS